MKLLEWAEDHVRLFQVLGILTTIASFFLGVGYARVTAYMLRRRQKKEYRRMENPGVAVIEAHVLEQEASGSITLNVIPWRGKRTFTDLLHDPELERKLEKVALLHQGFICLEQPGQLLVMDGLQEAITGNDSSANLDALKGRLTNVDEVIMCPVTWPGLREAHLIRIIVIDVKWIDKLRERSVIDSIRATRPRYQHRSEWLHEIALRWPEEKDKPEEEACIRLVEIESQCLI